MSGLFSDCARRLAGIAGVLLGWRPDEFWRATPAELAAVLKALTGHDGGEPASRADLERLERMFPDG
ncbi:MAG TPA: phage tail assembly chaperone [Allosphingosinicella sp.]